MREGMQLQPARHNFPCRSADANAIAQQALSNIRTVYSFNGEPRTKTAYSDSLQQPLKVSGALGSMGVHVLEFSFL